jgi:lysyl-tRNA synthetase, class II
MSQNRPEAEIRLDKLNELKKLGINPYPSRTPSFHAIGEVRKKKEGEKTATVGRITAIREHGKSTFFDIEDPEEKLQVYFKLDEVGEKSYELLKLLDVGDYVWISGEMFISATVKIAPTNSGGLARPDGRRNALPIALFGF